MRHKNADKNKNVQLLYPAIIVSGQITMSNID